MPAHVVTLFTHPHMLTFDALVRAYFDCRANKRNSKSALRFEENLERNLIDLYEALVSNTYTPGRSICFVVLRPKPREVWAAEFRDRIVHHLLYNQIAPVIESRFIADSCACIKGRGTLYGAKRLEHQVRSITRNWHQPAWYLKLDIANFFVSIDKRVLADLLCRHIHDAWWRALALQILMHDPRQGCDMRSTAARMALVPPHKRLADQPLHLGLPIGNLSSQFFANIYLNELDQHIKHSLRAPHYVRYVDDMVLLHHSAQWLNTARAAIDAWLPAHLGVQLNPRKTVLQPIDRGVDFVGHVIKPWRRETRKSTTRRAHNAIEHAAPEERATTANSYFGLLRQSDCSHHARAALAKAMRYHGHAVDFGFTKASTRQGNQS